MDRSDFHRTIKTEEKTIDIHVSQGELARESLGDGWINPLLLQIGKDGNFTCAYLSDEQVLKLIETLATYLRQSGK